MMYVCLFSTTKRGARHLLQRHQYHHHHHLFLLSIWRTVGPCDTSKQSYPRPQPPSTRLCATVWHRSRVRCAPRIIYHSLRKV